MKRSLQGFLTAFVVLVFSSAGFADKAKPKEWAFLIFLNGHNNLSDYGDLNINQLETVGSTADVDIVVQWAKLGTEKTHRVHVMKDNDDKKVTSPIIESLPRQDMGDYKNLVEFVRWSHEHFPAKRYFIGFWNHGSGWTRNAKAVHRGISYDDYSGNHITTEQMGISMREIAKIIGHKVDIVGADACLMAMGEVASEMQDSVEYYVASEELEPGLGWPYHTFIDRWTKNAFASSAEISRYLVEEYHKYLGSTMDITLSSMDLRQLPELWQEFRTMSQVLLQLPPAKLREINAVTSTAIGFSHADALDLGHWLKKAKGIKDLPFEIKAFDKLYESLQRTMVANKTSIKFQDADGMSFWVPADTSKLDTYLARYKNLRFGKETGWGAVLEKIVGGPPCELAVNGQWASEVLGFSSQYSEGSWSAKQALGACNTRKFGDASTAWAPKDADGEKEETLSVGFATPVKASGAIVRVSWGVGSVTKVETIDTNGKETVVWAGEDLSKAGEIANFLVEWKPTDYLVKGLKITINPKKTAGVFEEIDSIQLLTSK